MTGRRKEKVIKSGRGYIGSKRGTSSRQYPRPIYGNNITACKQIVTYLQSRMRLSTPSRVPTTPAAPLVASKACAGQEGMPLLEGFAEEALSRTAVRRSATIGAAQLAAKSPPEADGLRLGRVLTGGGIFAGRKESRRCRPLTAASKIGSASRSAKTRLRRQFQPPPSTPQLDIWTFGH
jgi:hypothetical protein